MVTIIFEAHGTSVDNEAGLSSGHFDVELSELGRRQAKELGQRYEGENFGAVFCSDLRRSYETAKIAFRGRNTIIIKDSRLRECDYGGLTRHSKEEVEGQKGNFVDKPFPSGESYQQTNQRMKFFLQDLLRNYTNKKVLIIGHRATQYALDHYIKGVNLHEAVVAPWKWQPGWTYHLEKL